MELFRTKIIGTGHHVPEKVVTNEDLTKILDTSHEWIVERTGIHERRISDLEKGETPSHLSYKAAQKAIDEAGIDPNEIDMIMLSVSVGDRFFPNTSSAIQEKLGITNKCPCVDISAACTGWVYGMVLANSLIQSGTYKNVLLISCEMTSAFNNWTDRSTSVLFGDGAGATLLSRNETDSTSQVHHTIIDNDSSKREILVLDTGAAEKPITHEIIDEKSHRIEMNGPEVFKAAVKTMCNHSAHVMEKTGWDKENLTWCVPHQANQRIIQAVAKRFDLSMDKVFSNVKYYANTSSASIPIALSEMVDQNKLQRGDNILCTAFGAGLTAGAITLTY